MWAVVWFERAEGALFGCGEELGVGVALAAEVEDAAAGDEDAVGGRACVYGADDELGVADFIALGRADGGYEGFSGEGFGDGRRGKREGFGVGAAVGEVVGDFAADEVLVVAFDAFSDESRDDLGEGEVARFGCV